MVLLLPLLLPLLLLLLLLLIIIIIIIIIIIFERLKLGENVYVIVMLVDVNRK
ncbi:unnamed protein product [Schistosoma mattheei]|uniref:Uncharacterized protein n=1 Tax=Schistosoma mattheei TaxID=31246 RepID=A0A3P8HMK9_9TREM|nr:unnamed protein product [Schistosoma mattheei]